MQLFSTEALTKCCGHGQEPRTAAQVSICLRLEKHTAGTSNLLCLRLTADPLCSKALGSFPGNGANSCPDSSAIADTFSTIPRGWDTPGAEASWGCRGRQASCSRPAHVSTPFSVCSRRRVSPEIMPCRKILTVPKATQIL